MKAYDNIRALADSIHDAMKRQQKLRDNFWNNDERITPEESLELDPAFTMEEVRRAVFESYSDRAPGPDGLPFLFYQHFWDLIKVDLMAMFSSFEKGGLNLARLNYATIILVPKEPNSKDLKKFRPISLLNCSFKIFSKVLNNRLIKICDRLIAYN